MDTVALIICWLTLWSGVFFYRDSLWNFAKVMLTVCIVAANAMFFVWAVVRLFRELAHEKGADVKMEQLVTKLRSSSLGMAFKRRHASRSSDDGPPVRWQKNVSLFTKTFSTERPEHDASATNRNPMRAHEERKSARRSVIAAAVKGMQREEWERVQKEAADVEAKKQRLRQEFLREVSRLEERLEEAEAESSPSPPPQVGTKRRSSFGAVSSREVEMTVVRKQFRKSASSARINVPDMIAGMLAEARPSPRTRKKPSLKDAARNLMVASMSMEHKQPKARTTVKKSHRKRASLKAVARNVMRANTTAAAFKAANERPEQVPGTSRPRRFSRHLTDDGDPYFVPEDGDGESAWELPEGATVVEPA